MLRNMNFGVILGKYKTESIWWGGCIIRRMKKTKKNNTRKIGVLIHIGLPRAGVKLLN